MEAATPRSAIGKLPAWATVSTYRSCPIPKPVECKNRRQHTTGKINPRISESLSRDGVMAETRNSFEDVGLSCFQSIGRDGSQHRDESPRRLRTVICNRRPTLLRVTCFYAVRRKVALHFCARDPYREMHSIRRILICGVLFQLRTSEFRGLQITHPKLDRFVDDFTTDPGAWKWACPGRSSRRHAAPDRSSVGWRKHTARTSLECIRNHTAVHYFRPHCADAILFASEDRLCNR